MSTPVLKPTGTQTGSGDFHALAAPLDSLDRYARGQTDYLVATKTRTITMRQLRGF